MAKTKQQFLYRVQRHVREDYPMRLLLVEDDLELASFITKGLEEHGFVVEHSTDGEEGAYLAQVGEHDAVIVDIMLPGIDGLTLVERLRKVKTQIPILILSAKRSVEEKVKGLRTGSDDYLTKPFAFVELLARIQALLRRSTSSQSGHQIQVGELFLDRVAYKVTRADREVQLKPKEFSILEYLMRRAGEVVTRTMLLEHVWDMQFDTTTNVVDVHICRLREKIDQGFEQKMIHTIRGVGYVLKAEQ